MKQLLKFLKTTAMGSLFILLPMKKGGGPHENRSIGLFDDACGCAGL